MPEEAVDVTAQEEPARPGLPPTPQAFRWRGQAFTVANIIRRWQDDPGKARGARRPPGPPFSASAAPARGRTYFRVRTQDGSVFDLAHDPGRPQPWLLLRRLSAGDSHGNAAPG